MQLPALASCPEFSTLSPSLAADLSLCFYRAAQARVPAIQAILHRHPSSLLGTVAHRVLDRARRRAFAWPESTTVLSQSEAKAVTKTLWDMEMDNVASRALTQGLFTDPRHWPGYAMQRARTIHYVATRLTGVVRQTEAHQWGAVGRTASEKTLTTASGDLTGIPDNLVFTEQGIEIEEFKTGRILDLQGHIQQRFREQVNLYAYLVHSVYGQWPVLVRLFTNQGEAYQSKPDPAEVEALVDRIRNLLREFRNSLAEAGSDPANQMIRLASPSVASCSGCEIRAWCEPFWVSGVDTNGGRHDVRGSLVEPWNGSGPMWLNTDGGKVAVAGLVSWHSRLRFEQGIQIRLLSVKPLPNADGFLFDGYSQLWWGGGEE